MTLKRFAVLQLFLIVVFVLSAYLWAQTPSTPPGFITASDLAFQLDGVERNRAVGRLMVRVDGKWIPALSSDRGGVVPLHSK